MTAAEYERLLESISTCEREASRSEGALQQLMARLKQEYGCDSLEEAEALLKKLEREQERLEGKVKKKTEEFEAEYGNKLKEEP